MFFRIGFVQRSKVKNTKEFETMAKSLDSLKASKEESYFDRKTREALERFSRNQPQSKPRLSPVSGQPMIQEVIGGVVVNRCPVSGGIWLDVQELEQIAQASQQGGDDSSVYWLRKFVNGLCSRKD